jgi:hypothetical protein
MEKMRLKPNPLPRPHSPGLPPASFAHGDRTADFQRRRLHFLRRLLTTGFIPYCKAGAMFNVRA